MYKHFLLIGLLCLMSLGLSAQGSVEGTVYFSDTDQGPVPHWPLSFFMGDGLEVATGETDEEGRFFLSTDATIAGGPVWWVETFDLCTGDLIRSEFEAEPGVLHYRTDVFLCAGIHPPPPPDTCQAFFGWEQEFHSDSSLTVTFYDLSFGPPPTDENPATWLWDFGDGSNGVEAVVTHTYAEPGTYIVTLTFVQGDCASTATQIVEVLDLSDCDCPTDEVIPVCVITPSGQQITFDNGCWAECAGYTEGEWFVCNEDCMCPLFYDPVCVIDADGDTLSFDNLCFAECEGFTAEEYFSCNPSQGCDCPEIYEPVCVATPGGGLILTFANACEAECAGYGPDVYYPCDGGCHCPEFYAPVCVINEGGDTLTFDNHCFAECEGFGPDQWFHCEPDACQCPDIYEPVCIVGLGIPTNIVFNNACEAECAGFAPGMYQPCEGECGCPDVYDPICVVDTITGDILSFGNFCLAQCAGYGPDQWTECEPNPCDCYDLYEPVCVYLPDGQQITFPNSCFAECEGYGPDQWIDCEDSCTCPEYYDPVCVTLANGDEVEFGNPCFALCAGYSPDQWTYCGNSGCDCPEDVFDPVCVLGPIGVVHFDSPCEAICAGFTSDQLLEGCGETCFCPEVWDPVCVLGPNGNIITFGNACWVACFGFSEAEIVDCGNDCICPQVYDPVCVALDSGDTLTFQNDCYALCEGYSPEQFVDCGEGTNCECDDFYLPVCVITAEGNLLEFLNPCEAVCAGFNSDQIIECWPVDDCLADFTFDFLSEDGLHVQFHDLSHLEGGTTSWRWDFGDGTTSTEPAPVHTYAEPGVYDVILTVSNDSCGDITVTRHICVGEGGGVPGPQCQAFFFLEQPNPDNLLTFQFLNLSMGDGLAYIWDFGDGTSSTEENPMYTYAEAGNYVVTLTVLSGNCENSVAIDVVAGENIWYGDLTCRAWFLPLIQPDSNGVFFINLSSPDAIAFIWDFGDGTTSDQPLAFHEYAETGVYTVTLTIITADGCTSTFATTVDFGTDNFSPAPPFMLVNDTDEVPTPATALTAWPNPTNGLLTIKWTQTQTQSAEWQLIDLNGRQLRQGQGPRASHDVQLELNMSPLPSGIYFFRLQTDGGVETLKLSKLE